MSVKPTKFQEVDPDTEYEIIPPGDITPDAVDCCLCNDGNQTYCSTEESFGSFVSAAAAQAFAFWYSR